MLDDTSKLLVSLMGRLGENPREHGTKEQDPIFTRTARARKNI